MKRDKLGFHRVRLTSLAEELDALEHRRKLPAREPSLDALEDEEAPRLKVVPQEDSV